ncbi:PRC-barrel domain-containing protein [Aminobacter anthyllidis]|uniref:PRC-barrel domain-containing protein n=1 Tax=Aminobacter anthyllidis TaxID=1035067 RepID=A0A9X1AI78_9HYPH|nr:PRC-barrel domain-containing protein [Aminobacter anthyllidis]
MANDASSDVLHVGEVKRLVLEKTGGKIARAVLGFGGFLGMGQDYYPIPWRRLSSNCGWTACPTPR